MARCTAKAKSTGDRCKRGAIHGGTVCRMHGGAAPQVQKKAAQRIADARDKALHLLGLYIDREKAGPDTVLAAVDKLTKLVELLEGRATNRSDVTAESDVDRELKATLDEWQRQLTQDA